MHSFKNEKWVSLKAILYCLLSLCVIGCNLFNEKPKEKSVWIQKKGLSDKYIISLGAIGSTIIAQTFKNGLFRSSDSGNTWEPINSGIPIDTIYTSSSLLVGHGQIFIETKGSGLFQSSDTGATWYSIGDPEWDSQFVTLLSLIDSTIFVRVYGMGVYKSADLGSSWDRLTYGFDQPGITAIFPMGDTLIAGAVQGERIIRSFDNGLNWEPANVDGFDWVFYEDIKELNGDLFAISQYQIVRTSDRGAVWSVLALFYHFDSYLGPMYFRGNEIIVGTVHRGVYYSIDNGDSWDNKYLGLEDVAVSSFIELGGTLYASTDQGLWVLDLSSSNSNGR